MADLFGTNGQAIAMGNARREQVRDLNERIKEHNDGISMNINTIKNQIAGQESTVKSSAMFKEIQDQATNIWAGKEMPAKIKAYNEWKASRVASNPEFNTIQTSRGNVDKTSGRLVDDSAEGSEALAKPVAETAPAGETAEAVEGGIESDIKAGLKNTGAVEESLVGKVASKVGVLGSAAMGGYDLYEDIKGGKIAGNNDWEKASNLLQIGGSVADIAGTIFPPAKLIGGILDIASGVTDSVGEKLDETKQASDLEGEQQKEIAQQQSEKEAPVQQITSQSIALGRTE
jgi:hypothetical protein